MRKLSLSLVLAVALLAAPPALAAPLTPSVFGGDLTCAEVTADGNVAGATGQTWCGSILPGDSITSTLSTALPSDRSTTKTFDGVPLDVNVAFPSTGSPPYPVVGINHGYGGRKWNFELVQRWLDQGYATYTLSQRGFSESCGTVPSRSADPVGCANGYLHLMDARYEVRDTQLLLGELVDEGLIKPDKIASTGGSYGGAISVMLAVLRDRMMMPDGTLVPWKSPDGTPMSLAVATPFHTWSELAYSLFPNGHNLDYIEDAGQWGRVGVMKEAYVHGLASAGFKAAVGANPSADIDGWEARLDAGEPYDGDPAVQAMIDELNTYHSSYGIDRSQPPAPLLLSSGFTDDLFPVNEATRFYNRTRAEYPDSPMTLFLGSFGHARGQVQANVLGARDTLQDAWVAHYLKGVGPEPPSNVTAYTQTCPDGASGGGPYTAPDWGSIAPGEIRLVDDGGPRTIDPDGADIAVGDAFNGAFGHATACATAPGSQETGTVNYELPAAPAGGYTVMGAATLIAEFTLAAGDDSSEVAARLVDVAPGGATKMLVERGLWRPDEQGLQVFQLFANGWRVEPGHVLRLELLPRDAASKTPGGLLTNYGRPSNNQRPVTIDDVDLRIPVLEAPGALDGLVTAPAPKVLPERPGVELARGYEATGAVAISGELELKGKPKVKGKRLRAKMICDEAASYSCRKAALKLVGAPKGKRARGRKVLIARAKNIRVDAGDSKRLKPKLTKRARKLFSGRHALRKLRTEVFINGESVGFTTIKRGGKGK